VELFTSEGCSSCPPAEEELARIEKEQPVPDALVVPIAWHVDYWDYLGWRDPFSSGTATERQRAYATGSSLYTPQAVVDGTHEVSGTRGGALRRLIADAARAPKANVVARFRAPTLEVMIEALPAHGPCAVTLVLVKARATVAVLRGENAGRTLNHTAIARDVRELGEVKSADSGARLVTKIDSGREVTAVVLVEQRFPRKVLGVGTVPVM
jgi:hypothetical protein